MKNTPDSGVFFKFYVVIFIVVIVFTMAVLVLVSSVTIQFWHGSERVRSGVPSLL